MLHSDESEERWLRFDTIDRGDTIVAQRRRKRILGFAGRARGSRRATKRRTRSR